MRRNVFGTCLMQRKSMNTRCRQPPYSLFVEEIFEIFLLPPLRIKMQVNFLHTYAQN